MRGFLKGGPGRAASTFVVTLFLVLAVMACQGPAGPAGTPGTPGKPGDTGPAGTPGTTPTAPKPQAPINPNTAGEISDMTLQEGWTDTVDVEGNFDEPQDQELTYTAVAQNTDPENEDDVATVTVEDSMVMVTAEAVGEATVTVTANDGTGGKVDQTFDVTVIPKMPPTLVEEGHDRVMLYVEGEPETKDVADYFIGETKTGKSLTYDVTPRDDQLVKAEFKEGSKSITMLTGLVPDDGTWVDVWATDHGEAKAHKLIRVVVMAGAPPETETPETPEEPEEPEEPESTDNCTLALKGKCERTLKATEYLESEDETKVSTALKGTSSTVWEATAEAKTDKDGVDVHIKDADHETVDTFTVVVTNSVPKPNPDKLPDPKGYPLTPMEELKEGDDRAFFYSASLSLPSYFKDDDGSADIADTWTTANIVSSTSDIIVRHVKKDGSKVYFDVLRKRTASQFTIRVTAEDKDKAKSAPVTFTLEWPEPHQWEYDVLQTDTGDFVSRPIGRRVGVEHTLKFVPRLPVGTAAELVPTGVTPSNALQFVIDAMVPASKEEGATAARTPTTDDVGNTPADDPIDATSASYVKISASPGVILGAYTPSGPGVGDVPMLDFELRGSVRETITFDLMIAYDATGGDVEVAYHSAAKRTLTLNIMSGTTTYSLQ